MKYFLIFIFFILFIPTRASAHIAGQPPFFLMNDKYADFYPVYTTSLPDFILPQDIAPETYFVNEEISMKIDEDVLPFPPGITDKIIYTWDFGDGTKGGGMENTHRYDKMGTYLLTITADYGGYQDEYTKSVLQAVVIYVRPDPSYELPKAVISANGKTVSDPLIDTLQFDEGTKITFSAENSENGSSQIEEYIWDLGDGKRRTGKKVSITYSADQAYVFPFLRVKTQDGFFHDSYIQIENVSKTRTTENRFSFIPLLIGVNILLVAGVLTFLLKKK